jgi:hypothetical protein
MLVPVRVKPSIPAFWPRVRTNIAVLVWVEGAEPAVLIRQCATRKYQKRLQAARQHYANWTTD